MIPLLLVLTVLTILDAVGYGEEDSAPTIDETARERFEPPQIPFDHVPDPTELPPGQPYVEEGSGEFRVIPGATDRVGAPDAELFTYTVEIEDTIDTADFGGDDAIAQMVDTTLTGTKGWTADGTYAFQRVENDEDPSFRVSLTAPLTIREFCGYTIEVEVSCFNPLQERTYINVARWTRGAHSFEGDIVTYRQYLINHEVGHAIGYPHHDPCPADGVPAPIMMQQSLSVRNSDIRALEGPESYAPDNDFTCSHNGWPFARDSLNPTLGGEVPADFVPSDDAPGDPAPGPEMPAGPSE